MKRQLFAILSSILLLVSAIWVFEELNPQWKTYQKAFSRSSYNEVKLQYLKANGRKRVELKKRLKALEGVKLRINQILLENGEVDRCITCHVDPNRPLLGIKEKPGSHPTLGELSFDIYGCTLCHQGDGRALTVRQAHQELLASKKDMLNHITESEAPAKRLFAFWNKLSELTPTTGNGEAPEEKRDFSLFSPTGRTKYLGSAKCLKCHWALNKRHVEKWLQTKFKTFEDVKKAPDFLSGDTRYQGKCYLCHTTGYDPVTNFYEEEGVTCETCHGAGEIFVKLMRGSRKFKIKTEGGMVEVNLPAEGAKIARANALNREVCTLCHNSRRHLMRPEWIEQAKEKPQEVPAEIVQLKNPLSPTPENIAAGKEIYTKNCLNCHGKEGKGDGPAAAALDPKPTDFTKPDWMSEKTDGELFFFISKGIKGTAMPGWEKKLGEEQRWQVLIYEQTFAGE